jgi:5-methylcytosine-specific restriction endonuclease McrA
MYKIPGDPEIIEFLQNRIQRTIKDLESNKQTRQREHILLQYVADTEMQIEDMKTYGYCYMNYVPKLESSITEQNLKAIARTQNYRNKHKDDVTEDMLMWSYEFFEGHCMYCGELHAAFDHIRPVSHGGTNTVNNIGPCCSACNLSKADQPLEQWYPRQDFFTEEQYDKILFHLEKGQELYNQYK